MWIYVVCACVLYVNPISFVFESTCCQSFAVYFFTRLGKVLCTQNILREFVSFLFIFLVSAYQNNNPQA